MNYKTILFIGTGRIGKEILNNILFSNLLNIQYNMFVNKDNDKIKKIYILIKTW